MHPFAYVPNENQQRDSFNVFSIVVVVSLQVCMTSIWANNICKAAKPINFYFKFIYNKNKQNMLCFGLSPLPVTVANEGL